VIPFAQVIGNSSKVAPEQIEATCVKVGVTIGFTVIVIVTAVVETHCPSVGVNVQVVVAKLFKAGDHVPVIPLLEVVGKADNIAPKQMGATCVKVAVNIGFTTIVIVTTVVETHCPAVGVNV
jgi:hypothetical protein